MGEFRIRIELNKGRVGIPLEKLTSVASETSKFLNLFVRDVGIYDSVREWVAERFENNSVDFDCRYVGRVDDSSLARSRQALKMLLTNTVSDPELMLRIRPATRRQCAQIVNPIDPDERIRVGLYLNGSPSPSEWFEIGKSFADAVQESLTGPREAFGEVQGIVHAFFKETERPYLKIRELSTQQLVNCYFRRELHRQAVEVLIDPDAVVFVEGWTTEDPDSGLVTEINVTDFRLAPEFDKAIFKQSLGSLPGYTGGKSTYDALREIRED